MSIVMCEEEAHLRAIKHVMDTFALTREEASLELEISRDNQLKAGICIDKFVWNDLKKRLSN